MNDIFALLDRAPRAMATWYRVQNRDPVALEVATHQVELQRGLSGRYDPTPTKGMVFAFPEPVMQAFWGRPAMIPLMIYYLRWERAENSMILARVIGVDTLLPGDERQSRPLELIDGAMETGVPSADWLAGKTGDRIVIAPSPGHRSHPDESPFNGQPETGWKPS